PSVSNSFAIRRARRPAHVIVKRRVVISGSQIGEVAAWETFQHQASDRAFVPVLACIELGADVGRGRRLPLHRSFSNPWVRCEWAAEVSEPPRSPNRWSTGRQLG